MQLYEHPQHTRGTFAPCCATKHCWRLVCVVSPRSARGSCHPLHSPPRALCTNAGMSSVSAPASGRPVGVPFATPPAEGASSEGVTAHRALHTQQSFLRAPPEVPLKAPTYGATAMSAVWRTAVASTVTPAPQGTPAQQEEDEAETTGSSAVVRPAVGRTAQPHAPPLQTASPSPERMDSPAQRTQLQEDSPAVLAPIASAAGTSSLPVRALKPLAHAVATRDGEGYLHTAAGGPGALIRPALPQDSYVPQARAEQATQASVRPSPEQGRAVHHNQEVDTSAARSATLLPRDASVVQALVVFGLGPWTLALVCLLVGALCALMVHAMAPRSAQGDNGRVKPWVGLVAFASASAGTAGVAFGAAAAVQRWAPDDVRAALQRARH